MRLFAIVIASHSRVVPLLHLRLELASQRAHVFVDARLRLRQELVDDALGHVVEQIFQPVELLAEFCSKY